MQTSQPTQPATHGYYAQNPQQMSHAYAMWPQAMMGPYGAAGQAMYPGAMYTAEAAAQQVAANVGKPADSNGVTMPALNPVQPDAVASVGDRSSEPAATVPQQHHYMPPSVSGPVDPSMWQMAGAARPQAAGAPAGQPMAASMQPNAQMAASAGQNQMGVEIWMDERELKRQRRKQSNRESARRSRLRKQAECEELGGRVDALSSENVTLRSELKRLHDTCSALQTDNAQLSDKLKTLKGDGASNGEPAKKAAKVDTNGNSKKGGSKD